MRMPPLNPQTAEQIRFMETYLEDIGEGDVDEMRKVVSGLVRRIRDDDQAPFHGVVTHEVAPCDKHAVPFRRYRPSSRHEGRLLLYFHGGGWVFGDLESGDRFAKTASTMMAVDVVSVHYRRAPEHPYPSALVDCLAVSDLVRNDYPHWVGVAGDSAGGNLAVAAAIARRDSGDPFDGQLIINPALDRRMTSTSIDTYAEGFGLTKAAMEYYWDAYAGAADGADPLLSPFELKDVSGLPPTVMATAGYDPLFDEGADFASRLVAAGVPIAYLPFLDMAHGFIDLLDRVDGARSALLSTLETARSFLLGDVAQ